MRISRDGIGRFQGTYEDQWYNHDDEYWQDMKVGNVVFPNHEEYQAGDVIVWNLNDKQNN